MHAFLRPEDVSHMFIVHVNAVTASHAEYRQSVAASVFVDNMLPQTHPGPSNAFTDTDVDADLHVHTEELRADIKKLVQAYLGGSSPLAW